MQRIHFITAEHTGGISPDRCAQALEEQLSGGLLHLTLLCPPAEGAAAYRFLRNSVDFLLDHPQIQRLELLCRAENRAVYDFQWNMWFAERRHD